MSSLWTRARHAASSCRCTLCNSSRSASLPHRSHINTTPSRRQTHATDVATTLFYGTVMGAALYTDASLKIRRRKKLEGDIDQAKNANQELEESNQRRMQALGIGAIDKPSNGLSISHLHRSIKSEGILSETIMNLQTPRLQYLHRTVQSLETKAKDAISTDTKTKLFSKILQLNSAIRKEERRLRGNEVEQSKAQRSLKQRKHEQRLDKERSQKLLRDVKMQSALRYHLLSSILSATPSDTGLLPCGRSPRDLWNDREAPNATPYQTKRQGVVMTQLIYLLLQYAADLGDASALQKSLDLEPAFKNIRIRGDAGDPEINSSLRQRLDEIEKELRALKSMRSAKWEAVHLSTSSIVSYGPSKESRKWRFQARLDLNNALSNLFASHNGTEDLILNVCKLLTSSNVFPDLHTFNILLVNLPRLQHHYAATLVWYALRMSGLAMNEISVAAILKTYAFLQYNEGTRGFQAIANQIDVKDGEGLFPLGDASAELASHFPELVSDKFYTAASWMGTARGFDVTQTRYVKVPRNEDIYEALIIGFLDIGAVDRACEEFNRMLQSGYSSNLTIFNSILLQILQSKDRELGRNLSRWVLNHSVTGTSAAARDSVYIMAELANLPPGGGSDNEMQIRDDGFFAEVNSFALKNSLINQPLQKVDFRTLRRRDLDNLKMRFVHIRSLEKPILHLNFTPYATENLSGDPVGVPLDAPGLQPANLLEYSAAKLRQLHDSLVQRHGPVSESSKRPNAAVAAAKSAGKWLDYHKMAQAFLSQKQTKRVRKMADTPSESSMDKLMVARAAAAAPDLNTDSRLTDNQEDLKAIVSLPPTHPSPVHSNPPAPPAPPALPSIHLQPSSASLKSKSSLTSLGQPEEGDLGHQSRWVPIKFSRTAYT